MVVCVLLPRFELAIAAGGRAALAQGPMALAPESGREQAVGEVSQAAEALGIHPGMRLGEALARAPRLALIPPDPVGVADAWERVLQRLETVGAAVESERAGEACFEAAGLRRLHGGSIDGVVGAVRDALRLPARIGAGPSRFCALAGAARARTRRAHHIRGAEDLAGEPVALLRRREETARLPAELERLGLTALGDVAALSRAALADRFGAAGLLAHDLAHGLDRPLRPRAPQETLEETLDLEEAASGVQLDRALVLLIERLLARPERRGRTLRAAVLAATLVEGGTWRERAVFREPTADPARMRPALVARLVLLPAPAESLRLTAEGLGAAAATGPALLEEPAERRRERLRDAVRQARTAAGPEAALRVLEVDPDSRIPERRVVLAPFEG
ncbi:MAG: hypothetical protein F2832_02115 [Actinobacteria bacterium]|nr:hypothetical protein [Actinomycetota bacterium]